MRVQSSSRFNRVISDAWSAGNGSGAKPGDETARDRMFPPRATARQFRNIDGEMPTSVAACFSRQPMVARRATVSRLNSRETPASSLALHNFRPARA